MWKNNFVLWLVYFFLFWWLAFWIIYSKVKNPENTLIFPYPTEKIQFWDTYIPDSWVLWYEVRERFDREFLITSNNLYQAFLYIKRSPIYFPYIESKLLEYKIHHDFLYLPLAESAFRNDVVSHAWAAGIWQFMPDTAIRYWLRVDQFIDERYHFEKSTEAAMKYISDLYLIFWDWSLAAAAYNRWENGLQRDIEVQWVNDYYKLYLNDETSRYVFRILAIKYLFASYYENKSFINTLLWWLYEKSNSITLKIDWPIDNLSDWAIENNYNYREIKILNPWIISNKLPEWSWDILFPEK